MFLSLHASIVNVHGFPWLHFEPLQLLVFDFDADLGPDPSFHSDVEPDPDPQHWSIGVSCKKSMEGIFKRIPVPTVHFLHTACALWTTRKV